MIYVLSRFLTQVYVSTIIKRHLNRIVVICPHPYNDDHYSKLYNEEQVARKHIQSRSVKIMMLIELTIV